MDKFPFPASDSYTLAARQYSLHWWLEHIGYRFRKHNIFAELILRRRRARLIHAHMGLVGWWSLPLKHTLKLPLVTTFYGFDLRDTHRGWQQWTRKRQDLFHQGDLFLVEGEHMQQQLIAQGCPAEKVRIQRIAIDAHMMPLRLRQPRKGEPTVIVFAGRFVEKKGLLAALDAVHTAHEQGYAVEFRIIGDGPQAPQVREQIEQHHMQDYVHLLGFLDHQQYLAEMEQADIFLHPSVTAADGDTEGGAPTTILEAQALGIPIVATYHADIPNVVVPDRSAVLAPEHDRAALVKQLTGLLDTPERWAEMGRAGRTHIEQHHDIQREVVALEDKYAALIR